MHLGTQFSCFTGTKVQILAQKTLVEIPANTRRHMHLEITVCFTGTKVQVHTQKTLLEIPANNMQLEIAAVFLLYW
jgi:hypothetical protein